MPIARAVRCTALIDAHASPANAVPTYAGVARIDVFGTQRARFLSALLRGRLRSVRTKLRPIDRTFPVARTSRFFCTSPPYRGSCTSRLYEFRKSVKRTLTPLSAFSPARVNKNAAITCSAHDEKKRRGITAAARVRSGSTAGAT